MSKSLKNNNSFYHKRMVNILKIVLQTENYIIFSGKQVYHSYILLIVKLLVNKTKIMPWKCKNRNYSPHFI
jgi:hypothetical protein